MQKSILSVLKTALLVFKEAPSPFWEKGGTETGLDCRLMVSKRIRPAFWRRRKSETLTGKRFRFERVWRMEHILVE